MVPFYLCTRRLCKAADKNALFCSLGFARAAQARHSCKRACSHLKRCVHVWLLISSLIEYINRASRHDEETTPLKGLSENFQKLQNLRETQRSLCDKQLRLNVFQFKIELQIAIGGYDTRRAGAPVGEVRRYFEAGTRSEAHLLENNFESLDDSAGAERNRVILQVQSTRTFISVTLRQKRLIPLVK